MKRLQKITAFVICIVATSHVHAQATGKNDYFVGFFAEDISVKAPVGHAFIGIGKGTPLTCNMDGTETEMYGFYPAVRIEGGKSIVFGSVSGKVRNDVSTQIDHFVFKRIDFASYIKVQMKIKEWEKKKYEVTSSDCISFFADIASLFSDIIVPDRNKYGTPSSFVKNFITINKVLQ